MSLLVRLFKRKVQQATKAAFEAQANAAASTVNVGRAICSSTEAQASATHACRIYQQVMEVQTDGDEAREAVVLSEEQAREHARSASSASATAAQVLSAAREVGGSVAQHAHNAIQSANAAANDACTASQLVTQVQEQCEGLSQQVEALCGGESDSDMPPLVSSAEYSDDDQRPDLQQGQAGQALKRRLRKWLQSTAVVATEANTQATTASHLASEAVTKAQKAQIRAEQGAATAQEALKCAKDAHGHIHDVGQRRISQTRRRNCVHGYVIGWTSCVEISKWWKWPCISVHPRLLPVSPQPMIRILRPQRMLTPHPPHGPGSSIGHGTMPTGQPSSSTPASLSGVPLGGTVPPLNNLLGPVGAGQQQLQQLQGMNPLNSSVQPGCPSGPSQPSSQFFQETPQSVPPNSTYPSLFSSQLYAQHTHPHISPTPSVPPIPPHLLSTKLPVGSTQGFQTLHGRTLWDLLLLSGAMQPLVEPVPHKGAPKMSGTTLGYDHTPIVSVGQLQGIFSQTYDPDCPEYGTRMTIWDRGLDSPDQAHMSHQAWGQISWAFDSDGVFNADKALSPPPPCDVRDVRQSGIVAGFGFLELRAPPKNC